MSGWTARAAPENNPWRQVAYGGGLFVAVADSGTNRIMTSPDGINWTARAAPENNGWHGLTYGNGLFVSVSPSGTNRVMTSPDGVNWTARSAPEGAWYSVAYGNGVFVATDGSTTNRVMTSPDGITWTLQTAVDDDWFPVTFGGGMFVATSFESDTGITMASPDGIDWTTGTAAENNVWRGLAHGKGLFVAVSRDGTNRVMTSPDGVNWTARAAAEANEWWGVAYGGDLFVAVARDGPGVNRVMTSPDGISWTAESAPENNQWTAITYGMGLFVAVADSGVNRVMTRLAPPPPPPPTGNIPLNYRAGIQVILHRVDGEIDLTHRVMTGSIDTGDVSSVGTGAMGSDAVVSTCTIQFDGDNTEAFPSLAPEAISPLNVPRPLLRPYRKITIRAGAPGEQVEDLFVGYLGDSVRVEGSASSRRVTVTARDIAKPFQDTFLRTFPVLGGVNATIPSVLQQLINLVPAAMRPDLVVPEMPNILLSSAYQPEDTTIWDVMQQLVTSMGWYLGARGGELHLLNPPRGDDVPDVPLDADDFFEDGYTVSDTDVRNRITIEYNASGASVTHEDAASINDITDGVAKHSYIRYASDSPITTAQAANEVAQSFLHDMSRPHAITRLNLPFLPSLKVFTMLGVRNPNVSADTRLVATTSVKHMFERGGKARTIILGAERVLGAHSNWLAQESQPAEALGLEVA